ncbi:zincin-like metallopeptidase toxin domain-containing protein [Hymenobacter crusticola]|uniref:Tox-MPTase4 domain-containing protein n=1 Tax=Hymenobacter crusticola TaxID=1770526 RepID=A0A243W520_9BACT|nr:zincin-like metallopeptidase toxin domain-containing protein [Hymenobacter crusticola]OUJ67776.1 hypothetical protein BXP70_28510 [Hymenobacter crusticola]
MGRGRKGSRRQKRIKPVSFEERRRSGTGYLGSKRLTKRMLGMYRPILAANYQVTLIVLKKGSPVLAYMDANGMRAGFSAPQQTIYIRRDATYFELAHEMKHAKHWAQVGAQPYQDLSTLEKETYVFQELLREKHNLTSAELLDAFRYINKIRADQGMDPLDASVLLP